MKIFILLIFLSSCTLFTPRYSKRNDGVANIIDNKAREIIHKSKDALAVKLATDIKNLNMVTNDVIVPEIAHGEIKAVWDFWDYFYTILAITILIAIRPIIKPLLTLLNQQAQYGKKFINKMIENKNIPDEEIKKLVGERKFNKLKNGKKDGSV